MTQEQALNTIEQALNIATQKGAFNLADTQAIIMALQVLKQNEGGENSSQSAESQG